MPRSSMMSSGTELDAALDEFAIHDLDEVRLACLVCRHQGQTVAFAQLLHRLLVGVVDNHRIELEARL